MIIPAAGLGKRFTAEGFIGPKELLPLGDKPLIGHALDEAERAGFSSAVVVLSPKKQALHEYLAMDPVPLPLEIVVQPEPLGIGDAVLRCWHGEPVAVLLPDDVVLQADHWTRLINANRNTGAAALCVRTVSIESTSRFGIAECEEDRVIRVVEKPGPGTTSSRLAIFGRYVITEQVIKGLAGSKLNGELELTYGFAAAIARPPGVRAVTFSDDIYDCGTPTEYALSMERFPN